MALLRGRRAGAERVPVHDAVIPDNVHRFDEGRVAVLVHREVVEHRVEVGIGGAAAKRIVRRGAPQPEQRKRLVRSDEDRAEVRHGRDAAGPEMGVNLIVETRRRPTAVAVSELPVHDPVPVAQVVAAFRELVHEVGARRVIVLVEPVVPQSVVEFLPLGGGIPEEPLADGRPDRTVVREEAETVENRLAAVSVLNAVRGIEFLLQLGENHFRGLADAVRNISAPGADVVDPELVMRVPRRLVAACGEARGVHAELRRETLGPPLGESAARSIEIGNRSLDLGILLVVIDAGVDAHPPRFRTRELQAGSGNLLDRLAVHLDLGLQADRHPDILVGDGGAGNRAAGTGRLLDHVFVVRERKIRPISGQAHLLHPADDLERKTSRNVDEPVGGTVHAFVDGGLGGQLLVLEPEAVPLDFRIVGSVLLVFDQRVPHVSGRRVSSRNGGVRHRSFGHDVERHLEFRVHASRAGGVVAVVIRSDGADMKHGIVFDLPVAVGAGPPLGIGIPIRVEHFLPASGIDRHVGVERLHERGADGAGIVEGIFDRRAADAGLHGPQNVLGIGAVVPDLDFDVVAHPGEQGPVAGALSGLAPRLGVAVQGVEKADRGERGARHVEIEQTSRAPVQVEGFAVPVLGVLVPPLRNAALPAGPREDGHHGGVDPKRERLPVRIGKPGAVFAVREHDLRFALGVERREGDARARVEIRRHEVEILPPGLDGRHPVESGPADRPRLHVGRGEDRLEIAQGAGQLREARSDERVRDVRAARGLGLDAAVDRNEPPRIVAGRFLARVERVVEIGKVPDLAEIEIARGVERDEGVAADDRLAVLRIPGVDAHRRRGILGDRGRADAGVERRPVHRGGTHHRDLVRRHVFGGAGAEDARRGIGPLAEAGLEIAVIPAVGLAPGIVLFALGAAVVGSAGGEPGLGPDRDGAVHHGVAVAVQGLGERIVDRLDGRRKRRMQRLFGDVCVLEVGGGAALRAHERRERDGHEHQHRKDAEHDHERGAGRFPVVHVADPFHGFHSRLENLKSAS